MVASKTAREKKASAQAGEFGTASIELATDGSFRYKITCKQCLSAKKKPWSTHRAGADNGFMAAMDRWIFHLVAKHPGTDAPCLEFQAEAEERLAAQREGGATAE